MDKYLVTGSSGFIGKRLLHLLPKSQILGVYLNNPPPANPLKQRIYVRHDLTKPLSRKVFREFKGRVVIHSAAYTHINKCELGRELGSESLAWKGNIVVTQNIIDYCREYNKKLVFLSTECVFSGEKEEYFETDKKEPKNWYGYTKSVAEDLIFNSGIKHLVIRGVVGYGQNGMGSNIIQSLVNNLIYSGKASAVTDQKISFTYVDDIIKGSIALLKKRSTGTFHIAGSQIATPYEMALMICKRLKISQKKVKPVTMVQFFGKDNANLRLKNAVLNSQKYLNTTGAKTTPLERGINKLFRK